MKIGIDIGHYQVKTSKNIIFDSKVTDKVEFGNKVDLLEIEGQKYYLGEGTLEIEARKFDKKNFIPLLLGAICKSTDDNYIDLAVGLPLMQYKNSEIKAEMKAKIEEFKTTKVVYNGFPRTINIRSISIYPEGISGFLYARQQGLLDEVGSRDCIIVDLGGKTTDISLVKSTTAKLSTSVDVGTIDIYYAIAAALKERYYDAKIEVEKIQDYLDKGFFYKGKKQDIKFAIDNSKPLFKRIYDELKMNYPINTEAVLLMGGGAKLLGSAFKNNIEGIIVLDDIDRDIFLNANGYNMLLK